MRLKQIKLVGFKSFVDATTVPFPQQMTAIVGPNGCGKSNIIDAVRWVLGESSAKNLRGDAMTDVIFNGANSRKPVYQASVELVFDNTQGRLSGSMADRSEISVKRLVTREATNSYFLNGTKCRRRDITDIFLGTGLGPRSYAIIEQGTISRLIESKPQELRVFIEEAAGISKYKERRRETETRIRATRDNLERLNDVRIELTQQIEKLHKQAEAAKRFKQLKKQERRFKAELAVLKWKKFDAEREKYHQKLKQAQLALEQLIAAQRQHEVSIIDAKQLLTDASEQSAGLQQQKLKLTADISRLEQSNKHAKQLRIDLQNDIQRIDGAIQTADDECIYQQQNLNEVTTELASLAPQLEQMGTEIITAQAGLAKLREQQEQWQVRWQQHELSRQQYQQRVAQIVGNITSKKQLMQRTQLRVDELEQQLAVVSANDIADDIEQLVFDLEKQAQLTDERLIKFQHTENEKDTLYTKLSHVKQELLALEKRQTQVDATHSALLTMQAQQGDWPSLQQQWLAENNIESTELLKQLHVESGWDNAVELVLSHWLHGHVVDASIATIDLTQVPEHVRIVSAQVDELGIDKRSLASKLLGEHQFNSLLGNILAADNLAQARQWQQSLQVGQSVICPEGYWFGSTWCLRGDSTIEGDTGFISREKTIALQANQLAELNDAIAEQCQCKDQLTEALTAIDNELDRLKQGYQQSQQLQQSFQQELALKQQKQQQISQQLATINESLLQYKQQLADESAELEDLLIEEQVISDDVDHDDDAKQTLAQEKSRIDASVQQSQQILDQLTSSKHQIELDVSSLTHKQQAMSERITAATQLIVQQRELKQELSFKLDELMLPLNDDEANLQHNLTELSVVEAKLADIMNATVEAQQQVSQFEQSHSGLLNDIAKQQQLINENHIEAEGFSVRAKSALEPLNDLNVLFKDVCESIDDNANIDLWQFQLEKTTKAISRLGAINLAAIEEYELQFERKKYLDEQNDDLELALDTLEAAIAKIDRESRAKFKATFEQVNSDLQTLFPKVFGGGQAYLELTGDDLLDTGVSIMARPPGKKNSTIHLLSGGEKALTALSLVFAIFRLNPAPFCMLDEVDAPLDDANVGRFCKLVQEMSQTVQFVYISHNKIAMEMATQLTGVTMHEPGVSRMVAVDIDEAIAMADM